MTGIHTDLLGTETRYVETAKYRTRVISAVGDGSPLFLLHGGGGHAETYSRNLVPLSQVCRPLAIDFIWHGLSSAPPFSSSPPTAPDNWLAQFTDQVIDLMDHEGMEKASVEGESLGGWIGFDMAINHPRRIDKLILNTAWGMALDPDKVAESGMDLEKLRETSINALNNPSRDLIRQRLEWLMPRGGVTDELVETRFRIWSRPQTRDALIAYYDHLFAPNIAEFYFTEDQISTIRCPTLVLWTDSNPIHGVDAAERLIELIPGAELHVIKNAAHWPQWEHPEEHDRVVAEFMRS